MHGAFDADNEKACIDGIPGRRASLRRTVR